jgi:hypothetical protein
MASILEMPHEYYLLNISEQFADCICGLRVRARRIPRELSALAYTYGTRLTVNLVP